MAAKQRPDDNFTNRQKHIIVLAPTRYDRVVSSLVATLIALTVVVLVLIVVWYSNRPPSVRQTAPMEFVELAGGDPEGSPDETFQLESPEDETLDPSLAEEVSEETQVQEMLETVVELSDQASQQVQEVFDTAPENTGNPGSAHGTGRRPLGMGPGSGGFPREQRWFVRFPEGETLDEYVRELTYFGIELGALFPDGRLVYLSDLKSPKPKVRVVRSGKGEKRLYMIWRGGQRRKGDIKLFKRAGIDVSNAVILHFYPKRTEQMLAQAEYEYRKRPPQQIRRTYFAVVKDGNGYKFVVTKQLYVR